MRKSDKYGMMPVQPYLILGTDQYQTIVKQGDGISHFYHFVLEEKPQNEMTAVPDGSVDLLFGIGENDIRTFIGGTVLSAKRWEFEEGRKYFGVCFQPGGCHLPAALSIGDLVNNDLEIDGNLFGANLLEKLAEAKDLESCSTIFLQEYRRARTEQFPNHIGTLEQYMRMRIYEEKGNISIKALAEETGYSECYIRRIFRQAHGISPKNFERFVRFQNVLHIMNHASNRLHLDELAQECRYFDEPHMMKDFKSFAGVTPQSYNKMIEGTKLRAAGTDAVSQMI